MRTDFTMFLDYCFQQVTHAFNEAGRAIEHEAVKVSKEIVKVAEQVKVAVVLEVEKVKRFIKQVKDIRKAYHKVVDLARVLNAKIH